MPVVTNGQRSEVLHRRPSMRQHSLRGLKASTRVEGKYICMEMYGPPKVRAALDDLTLVRERFGTNISESLQLSLHLVAEAIRAGRFAV